jgi:hypothetical protein
VAADPPTGAGGFAFGSEEADVKAMCEKAQHAYSAASDTPARCDGVAADVGATASAGLTYCGGRLCEVSLRVEVVANADLVRALARWRAKLVELYGKPTASQATIPARCDGSDLRPCVRDGTANVHVDWRWPGRQSITLTPRGEAETTWIAIDYASAELAKSRTSGL